MYQIEVYRDCTTTKSVIFRRYREFDELHRKLAQYFPEDTLPVLPGKIFTPGKSNTKEVRMFLVHNNYSIYKCLLLLCIM